MPRRRNDDGARGDEPPREIKKTFRPPQHVQEKGVFHGKTPLMWASSQGRTEIVNLLISAGADVDLASQTGNFRGKTSLMWASSQGRLETVASLLQHGSNVNALDGDKMSALMWAAGTCYVLCFMYYMSLSCSKSLNSPNPCQNLTVALPLALLIYLFILYHLSTNTNSMWNN